MAFTTENRSISDIFQRSAQYIVPRYQRTYVWNKVNWKELWNDLTFTIKNSNQNIPWSHFLGTIVLNKEENKKKNLEIYEVIDGQQRLMTIYVLLIVLYKNFSRIESDDARQRATYIRVTFLTSLNNAAETELVISNENYDNDLKEFMDYAVSEENHISESNALKSLFVYFDSLLVGKNFDYLDLVLEKLLNVNIVEIISGEDEEIYNIFEVLNARGQKLRQIDLLKNHIMKYIQPRKNIFIDQAKMKWNLIVDNIDSLNDPDVLIQHFAKCYIEKKAENQNSVYRLIKEEIGVDSLGIFLDDLLEFSEIYKRVTTDFKDDSVLNYFKIKNNSQIRSLICAIYILEKRNIITNKTANNALKQLRNFFFIFNVTRQTSNKTDKLISNISYVVYYCRHEVEFRYIFTEFLLKCSDYIKKRNYKDEFINNTSFRYSNVDKSLRSNNHLVRYILDNIYSSYQNDTNIPAHEMTIEHLISDDGKTPSVSIENLTLTTEELNANRLKNKSIGEKINILREESSIQMNKRLDKYFKDGNFNFKDRLNDLVTELFDKVFNFDTGIFNLSPSDIKSYRLLEKTFSKENQNNLIVLLKKHGKHIHLQVNSNSKYIEYKDVFNQIWDSLNELSWNDGI